MSKSVSVVVTTRNSAPTLEACLKSIRNQSVQNLELLVIDNFSTDGTVSIAERYADFFQQSGPERSSQRNIGASRASGRFVLFLDSDMVLPPQVVEECLRSVADGATAVIVPEVSVGSGYWTACKALERSCYLGDDTIEAPRFVERDLFIRLAGFDESLTAAEDWDLAARIRQSGAVVSRTATPIHHDEGRLTLVGTMKTKFYYGRTIARYIQKHPELSRGQIRLFRPAYRRHAKALARRPLLTAGMFVMRASEIVAGGLGMLTRPV